MDPRLNEIREKNRRALGMAGVPAGLGACCASCEHGGTCEGSAPKNAIGPWGQFARAVPGMGASPLSLVPDVRIVTAFPAIDRTFTAGSTEPVQQGAGNGWLADWLVRHVVRPEVYVGPIRVAPYANEADYSGLANALAIGLFGIGVALGSVVIGRAIYPTSWIGRTA